MDDNDYVLSPDSKFGREYQVYGEDWPGNKIRVDIHWVGGNNCETLDFGSGGLFSENRAQEAMDKCNAHLKGIVDSCDTDKKGQILWKQGGRSVRGCIEYIITVDNNEDFKQFRK